MKIKRFEANNMSEALRQIKKEFGQEAVILSAKTNKKGQRFLGKKSSSQVVVTAAVDKNTNASDLDRTASEENHNTKEDRPHYNENSILKRYNPITRTGRKIIQPKIVQQMASNKEKKSHGIFYQRFIDLGMSNRIATEWDQQLSDLLSDRQAQTEELQQALAQVVQAKGIVGTTFKSQPGQPKCVVMMGPAGAGKTCAVAKMAAQQALEHPNSIAMISLDNQRVAGSLELERFAKIMGVPFKTAFSAQALKEEISQLGSHALIIIDTPAISALDHIQREKLRRLVASIDNAENLLVLNAALEERAMGKIIEYFSPLHIHSLVFTQLDWAVKFGGMINQSESKKIPIGFFSDSPKIPEGIRISTPDYLAGLLVGKTNNDQQNNKNLILSVQKDMSKNAPYYVANSNSDIFHFHKCKAVGRINTDNMIVFENPAEAMGQRFKPCRMCCSELIVPKPLDRQVRAYAGNR